MSTEILTRQMFVALPSQNSAMALVNGEPGAIPMVLAHTALRAGIIGAGLYVAGQRGRIIRTALVSSLAIETFVLLWAGYQKRQQVLAPPVNT